MGLEGDSLASVAGGYTTILLCEILLCENMGPGLPDFPFPKSSQQSASYIKYLDI